MCLAAIALVNSVTREQGALVAEVDVAGKRMHIGADFTPELEPGMYVVVHAGFAVRALTPDEAADALAIRADIAAAADPGVL